MIGWFPDPYPDELFYSICARYFDIMGYQNEFHATQELFGKNIYGINMYLANNLDYLIKALPLGSVYTADLLIDKHTLLPYCSPFYAPYLIRKNRDELKKDYAKFSFHKPRITPNDYLKFCPECFIEDRKEFGECYWHRLHQLPGVEICPRHEIILETSQVQTIYSRSRLITAEKAKSINVERYGQLSKDKYKIFIDIAHNADWLLKQSGLISCGDSLRQRCIKFFYLKYKNFHFKDKNLLNKLLKDFIEFYSPEVLELLQCELPNYTKSCWLIDIFLLDGKIRKPLCYILLIIFLGYTTEQFFQFSLEDKKNDLNTDLNNNLIFKHFQKPINVTDTKYVLHFHCEYCKSIQKKLSFRNIMEHIYSVSKMNVNYSRYWQIALKSLLNNQYLSYEEIAQELGVSEKTIKYQLSYLRIS
jgi:hypothetical protein